MIMFYDVMMIDDDLTLHEPYIKRRHLLEKLVTRVNGRADCAWQTRVCFSKPEGAERLKKSLALAFVRRWEGLVLKSYDEPYFDLARSGKGKLPSRWIKLKKDCIKGLGDTADFAVVGGGYDAGKAAIFNLPDMVWSHFYVGCLRNKEEVLRSGAKPRFLVFDEISDCMKKVDMKTLNELGKFRQIAPESRTARDLFDVEYVSGLPRMTTLFRCPFVFDVAGSGFDKSPNREIFTLRFPRVMKVHWDRDWKETVGLDELQQMAIDARKVHSDESSEIFRNEIKGWVGKLNELDRRGERHLRAWDSSDDEGGQSDFDLCDSPTTTIATPVRRSRVSAAPPLVRMDTGEMRNKERRLSSGEVVERPTSKHSMASITSNGSLQTPPTSSPLSKSTERSTRQQSSTDFDEKQQSGQRKRCADDDLHETLRRLKKARPQPMQESCVSNTLSSSSPTVSKKPLREITNSARTLQPPLAKAGQQNTTSATPEFSLVKNIPLGPGEFCHRQQAKPRVTMEPSSPGRETTATPSTAAPTTQSTADHHIRTLPNSPTPRPKITVKADGPPILTSPSTAGPPMIIRLPDLQESKIILSARLIFDHVPIKPLEELLTTLSVTPSSFRQALTLPQSKDITSSTPQPTSQILVLIDANHAKATSKAMWQIVKNVPIWHPIPVAFWDWRLLNLISNRDNLETGEQQEIVEALFFARMTWNTEWEGQGAVEVRWRDGSVDRVPIEGLGG